MRACSPSPEEELNAAEVEFFFLLAEPNGWRVVNSDTEGRTWGGEGRGGSVHEQNNFKDGEYWRPIGVTRLDV